MKYAADIIAEFSRKTGIKDPKLDVILKQQKERNVLWLPQPDTRDEWNLGTKSIGVDVGFSQEAYETVMVFFDECTTTRNEFEERYHGKWDFDDAFRRGFRDDREYYDKMKHETRRDEERRARHEDGRGWYVMTGISKWEDDEEVVDAEWRDITDIKALPEA